MNSNRFTLYTPVSWALVSVLLVIATMGSGCGSKSSPTAPPPSGPAILVVRSSPGAVPIGIDGATPANWTPSTLSLPAGNHTIGLKFLGYRDTTIAVSLYAATRETLTVQLGPGPGTPRSFGRFHALYGQPDDLAAGPYGPIFVTAGAPQGMRDLTAFALDGTILGSCSLGYNTTTCLAVAANGDAYLAEMLSVGEWVLSHFTSTAAYSNAIYYGAGNWPWVPCSAMGTGDTLLVLSNSPQHSVLGRVEAYLNDQWTGQRWETGISVAPMAVDRAARRCYFAGAGDTVHVFSTGGQRLTSWRAGTLNRWAGLMAVQLDGSVYVADAFTVRRFTGDGVPLAAWGVGDIGTIAGLAVDSQGRVYVAASETKQIVRYVP